jgi:hypothetical protein
MKAARDSHTVHREFGSAHTMPMHTTEAIPIPEIGECGDERVLVRYGVRHRAARGSRQARNRRVKEVSLIHSKMSRNRYT